MIYPPQEYRDTLQEVIKTNIQTHEQSDILYSYKGTTKKNLDKLLEYLLSFIPENNNGWLENEIAWTYDLYYKYLDCTENAIKYWKLAINCGNINAIWSLGTHYLCDKFFDRNNALLFLNRGIELGSTESVDSLVNYYLEDDDYKSINQLYEKAIESGLDEFLFDLAANYWIGRGVEINQEKAINLYKKSSTKGNKKSIDKLIFEYRNKDIDIDKEKEKEKFKIKDFLIDLGKNFIDEKNNIDPYGYYILGSCTGNLEEKISYYGNGADLGEEKCIKAINANIYNKIIYKYMCKVKKLEKANAMLMKLNGNDDVSITTHVVKEYLNDI